MDYCSPTTALPLIITGFSVISHFSSVVNAQLPEPNVEVGSDALFYCTGDHSTTAWYRGDEKLGPEGHFTVVTVQSGPLTYSNMTIFDVVKNDSGIYSCKDDQGASYDVTLTVYEVRDVVISPAEPEFVEDANLLLNCTVDGTTDQTVSWSVDKDGTPETLTGGDDTSHVQVFNNGSLIIRGLTPEDAGVYTCTHTFDEASKSASVNVGGAITLTAEKSVKYTEGDRALIECEAHVITAALLPSISWKVNGVDLAEACPERCTLKNTTTTHTITSKLEIVSIIKEDRKNYTCTATNAANPEGVSKDILLRVRDRLAALWPFLGIVTEVVILIIIILIHEKCSKGEDYGEDDEDDDEPKKEKKQINDGESDIRMRSSKE
nr:basigin-like [Lytechinus pictus]